jgi:hypothetical protein
MCGLSLCIVLAGTAHAPASMAASSESVRVVQVVQLPPRLDRTVVLNLQHRLDAVGPQGAVVVEVLTPATLDDRAVAGLAGIAGARAHGSLVVWLEDQRGGGPGGALLFALASVRLAYPGAAAAAHRVATAIPTLGPGCQGRCAQVVHSRLASPSQAAYPTLTAYIAAQHVRPQIAGVLGSPPGNPASSGGFPLSGIALIVILAIGAAIGWYLALRGKKRPPASLPERVNRPSGSHVQSPEGPGPTGRDPVARPARLDPPTPAVTGQAAPHEGWVRTELHPQGYIELGGCLYRVTWAGPPELRPEMGELVQVARDRAHGLVAFPAANSGGPSSGSTPADPGHPSS